MVQPLTTLTVEQLETLLDNPPSGAHAFLVPPEVSRYIFDKYNGNNRPTTRAHTNKLARQMKAGEWRLIPQPGVFSKTRKLLDAGHRFRASAESGIPIPLYLMFDQPDEDFAYYDNTKSRSGSDVLAIHGVPNAATASAITRVLMWYHLRVLNNPRGGVPKELKIDNPQQIYVAYKTFGADKIAISAHVADKLYRNHLPHKSALGAAYFLAREVNSVQADTFFEQLATGIGFTNSRSKVRKLRDRLLRTSLKRYPAMGDTIQTWNSERHNEPMRCWYSESLFGTKFPEVH